ncbi:MAG: tetratricopeptide repeat protein [Acidimicrobiales bacterium]
MARKPEPKGARWGSVARRGADAVDEGNTASAEWRRAVDRARGERERERSTTAPVWEAEVLARTDRPSRRPEKPVVRSVRPPRKKRTLPEDIAGELAAAGGAKRAPRLRTEVDAALEAYVAARYPEAERRLRPVAKAAPQVAAVRELYGLTLYRLGRWNAALLELDAYHVLTGELTQYPVVADCERALGHHRAVDEIWAELRRESPGIEVLSEGRLVAAGSLADRGRFKDAIGLLAGYQADRARPKEWHLRTWYALADLYERAGDVQQARELFRRLVAHDAGFFDAAERLTGLG